MRVKIIIMAANGVVCAGSITLAASAWWKHAEWERTGAHSQNSFPMRAFAKDATWFASWLLLASLLGWAVALWWIRRRSRIAKQPMQADGPAGHH